MILSLLSFTIIKPKQEKTLKDHFYFWFDVITVNCRIGGNTRLCDKTSVSSLCFCVRKLVGCSVSVTK
jgi:hypothetical protein